MKGYACIRVFNGAGVPVSEVIMTKKTLYIGRTPAKGAVDTNSDPNSQYLLVPPECKSVSKLRHIKIFWRVVPTPSFVVEVIGRCNGACIQGIQYGESRSALLPEDSVSTISVGQSCYIFFAPAYRVFNPVRVLKPIMTNDAMAPSGELSQPAQVRRFPKLWSKAIMDVFTSASVTELSKDQLILQFNTLHALAVSTYFLDMTGDIDAELWANLKRFVSKPPFEFDPVSEVIKFDPSAVKVRAPPGAKKPRLGSEGEDDAMDQAAAVTDSATV